MNCEYGFETAAWVSAGDASLIEDDAVSTPESVVLLTVS